MLAQAKTFKEIEEAASIGNAKALNQAGARVLSTLCSQAAERVLRETNFQRLLEPDMRAGKLLKQLDAADAARVREATLRRANTGAELSFLLDLKLGKPKDCVALVRDQTLSDDVRITATTIVKKLIAESSDLKLQSGPLVSLSVELGPDWTSVLLSDLKTGKIKKARRMLTLVKGEFLLPSEAKRLAGLLEFIESLPNENQAKALTSLKINGDQPIQLVDAIPIHQEILKRLERIGAGSNADSSVKAFVQDNFIVLGLVTPDPPLRGFWNRVKDGTYGRCVDWVVRRYSPRLLRMKKRGT